MTPRIRMLLIDDSPDDRALIVRELRRSFPDLQLVEVGEQASYARALEGNGVDLIITDYQLGWTDGLAVLHAVKARWPGCPVIICTGSGNEEVAVATLKAGAADYVMKAPRHLARLPAVVQAILKGSELTRRSERRRSAAAKDSPRPWATRYTFADIIGSSPALVQVRELAMQVAQAASSVLLIGESGTGKELFAQAIHAASPGRTLPFVPVDCAAMPRELLEAELFGYAPGAFTDAAPQGKPGKFELAQGGTTFLDEIGEMPMEMQAKLLRALQEREVVRVGGVCPIPIACRVIAATNRDLEALVAQGSFRQELLYRLDVIRLEIPPLRERVEDIPLLVAHYWAEKSGELQEEAQLSDEALRVLEGYPWMGNVRELVNVLERLLVEVPKAVIEAQDLPVALRKGRAALKPMGTSLHLPTVVAETERQVLEQALLQAGGKRTLAARLLGLSRATFYRKLKASGNGSPRS